MKVTKEEAEILKIGLDRISGALSMYVIHGCTVAEEVDKVFYVVRTLIEEAENGETHD